MVDKSDRSTRADRFLSKFPIPFGQEDEPKSKAPSLEEIQKSKEQPGADPYTMAERRINANRVERSRNVRRGL